MRSHRHNDILCVVCMRTALILSVKTNKYADSTRSGSGPDCLCVIEFPMCRHLFLFPIISRTFYCACVFDLIACDEFFSNPL